ncbi:glycosyltransferase [Rathayibacter festucae]|uniref:Glycosyltransferase n=1 Tax=Rathayibacter festucae DSM 15932 TaxID=1328866 RepID=A0A3Q9UYU7_9MICO|nr:glycosyltransferase [Rathayibacter festucae]AZZ53734.1 glycosyltransferase [Rathayibacter festucae DSM 15932]
MTSRADGTAPVLSTALPYSHLDALTDAGGLFEHALLDVPRREHGYCVDDVARALIVVAQEPEQSEVTRRLTEQYLRFLERASAADGTVRNRVSADGDSPEEPSLGDWWGRAVWAAGVVAARAELPLSRHRGMRLFQRLAARRSPHLRAMTSAVLGAVEVLEAHPESAAAAQLVADGSALLHHAAEADWPWPEPRLRYANGCLPEALLAAGAALGDPVLLARGFHQLAFLLALESGENGLSVCGVAGRGPGETGALFDQQPIEVAALAAACARALTIEEDPLWRDGLAACWAWFRGVNDSGTVMIDPVTGAGYDGLTPTGRNENRGAESTIAALHTSLVVRRAELAQAAAA